MKRNDKITVLGIESSCDETAAAIVSYDNVTKAREILSNEIISQILQHKEYGGVVPEIAARTHMEHIEKVIQAALDKAGYQIEEIDAIAVTSGPGLIGGVIVGVMAAKSLASVHKKPIYAINHLAAHALTARLTNDTIEFPYLTLLVSGGHCQILAVKGARVGVGEFTKLGSTIDDALGEAFDKTAKMMGLPYPGGPEIEKIAKTGDAKRFDFPKPLCNKAGCDFSFSGLKTAIRQTIIQCAENNQGKLTEQDKSDIAASFQRVVVEILHHKIEQAINIFKDENTSEHKRTKMVIAGGVAANEYIRKGLKPLADSYDIELVAPPIPLCTDNAVMIAWAAIERIIAGDNVGDNNIEPRARWELE